jgi:S1-C subfamily serine protease
VSTTSIAVRGIRRGATVIRMSKTSWIAILAATAAMLQTFSAEGAGSPREQIPPGSRSAQKPRPSPAPLGLRVAVVEPAQAQALGLAGGLSVVHATGAAEQRGLRVGDVITEVDGRPVADQTAFWDAMEAARWRPTLSVWRAGERLTIRLAAPDAGR